MSADPVPADGGLPPPWLVREQQAPPPWASGNPTIERQPTPEQSTRAPVPVPVQARIRWTQTGRTQIVDAYVIGWTRDAVEVVWNFGEAGLRRDWLAPVDVRRWPR